MGAGGVRIERHGPRWVWDEIVRTFEAPLNERDASRRTPPVLPLRDREKEHRKTTMPTHGRRMYHTMRHRLCYPKRG